MWCPKCRYEYREGITVCPDCGSPLVESLEEYDKEQAEKEQANLAAQAELQHEAEELVYGAGDELIPGQPDLGRERPVVYQDSATKAEESRSSAIALLGVGIVGFVFTILLFFNLIPVFHFTGSSRYFVSGVMGAMFVLFIVMGVISMKSVKTLREKADKEHSLEQELKKWCAENLSAKRIDEAMQESDAENAAVSNTADDAGEMDTRDEVLYFKRAEKIKQLISAQFVNLDSAFLDHFSDEIYNSLYEYEKTDADATDSENTETAEDSADSEDSAVTGEDSGSGEKTD
jgi:hypothetical protein